MRGLGFYGILDFFPNRVEIKKEYDKLSLDEKILYKKQVYSICFEKEYVKDLIWEYLNGWEESQFNLGKEWRLKKTKMEQRRKDDSYDPNDINELEYYYKIWYR